MVPKKTLWFRPDLHWERSRLAWHHAAPFEALLNERKPRIPIEGSGHTTKPLPQNAHLDGRIVSLGLCPPALSLFSWPGDVFCPPGCMLLVLLLRRVPGRINPGRTLGGQRGDSNFQEILATVVHALLPLRSLYQPSHGVEPAWGVFHLQGIS